MSLPPEVLEHARRLAADAPPVPPWLAEKIRRMLRPTWEEIHAEMTAPLTEGEQKAS